MWKGAESRLGRCWLQLGEFRLHIRLGSPAQPTGPPVLLVPGLVMSGRYLTPTATELAAHRRVVAPDLPGAGCSPHPPEPLTVPELADLAHELLTATPGPAVVVGNSFGCVIAVELALRHPEAVRRLVLTSPVIAPKVRNLAPVVFRFLATMRHEPRRYFGVLLFDALRGWTRKGRANLRALLGYPIEDRARRLTVPVLVVRGRQDRLVPAPFGRRLAEEIPQGTYVEMPAAHALPYDAPSAITQLILDADEEPPCPR